MGIFKKPKTPMKVFVMILALSAVAMAADVAELKMISNIKDASTHYENPWTDGSGTPSCRSDEKAATVTGIGNGVGCFPMAQGNACPNDFPEGNTASPYPVLDDGQGNNYCALVCAGIFSGHCAPGAVCVANGN